MKRKEKKTAVSIPFLAILTVLTLACKQTPDNQDRATAKPQTAGFSVTLSYAGPSFTSWKALYAAWIEDEKGNNLQNLYICDHVRDQDLTGTVLPYWETTKRTRFGSDIDAVTGASIQGNNTVTRDLKLGTVSKIRVCLEIDRSKNLNDYFIDRPSFIYKTTVIDLNNLDDAYDLTLNGWMSNDTVGTYSQTPTTAIAGWSTYKYMENLAYIAETGTSDSWNDMVTSLTAIIEAN